MSQKKEKADKNLTKNSAPKAEKAIKKKPFEVPQSILNQLNECTGYGYILICTDEKGDPQVYDDFDSEIAARGMYNWACGYIAYMNSEMNGGANGSDEMMD